MYYMVTKRVKKIFVELKTRGSEKDTINHIFELKNEGREQLSNTVLGLYGLGVERSAPKQEYIGIYIGIPRKSN